MATTTAASTADVANELVTLCRAGRNMDAIEALYSSSIVSIEPMGDEAMPARMEGIDAIRAKNQWWGDNHEVHSAKVEGPYLAEGQFATHNSFDVTYKPNGKRFSMSEVAVYTVKDGKIVEERFFYTPGA